VRRTPSTSQNRKAEPSWSLNRLVSATGTTKNRPIASARPAIRQLRVGGDVERLEADVQRLGERDDAADDGPAQDAVALRPGDERERLHGDLALGGLAHLQLAAAGDLLRQRLADGDGPRGDAAHHHALEDSLAAHGGVTLGLEG
jgi:hypothetical protein